jgi:hypothetical protein
VILKNYKKRFYINALILGLLGAAILVSVIVGGGDVNAGTIVAVALLFLLAVGQLLLGKLLK